MKQNQGEWKKSRRQKLGEYVSNGNLRNNLEMHSSLDHDAIDLLVDIAIRYCEPKRRRY